MHAIGVGGLLLNSNIVLVLFLFLESQLKRVAFPMVSLHSISTSHVLLVK